MEVIQKKYEIALQSLKTLEESINYLHNPKYQEVYKNIRDSVIQRFEYSIDCLWKFLKLYIQEKHKEMLPVASPRAILKEAHRFSIINNTEFTVLLDCIADRNLTSHTYNEEFAEEMVDRIPHYYNVMQKILKNIHF